MKKILVVGAMYSLNLGDAVICETVRRICEEEGAAVDLLDINGADKMPDYRQLGASRRSRMKCVAAGIKSHTVYKMLFRKRRYKKLDTKLKQFDPKAYDLVLFAGGQLFMDYFILQMDMIVQWAEQERIPVAFNCCGMGKITGFYQRILKKMLLKPNVISITLRDGKKAFEQLFAGTIPVKQILDAALDVAKYHPVEHTKKHIIGIGIIAPKDFRSNCICLENQAYIRMVSDILSACAASGFDCELFTNGEWADEQYCHMLAREIGCEDKVALRPQTAEELIATVGQYEKIVSFRLHSHIIAYSYRIPTLGIVWDEKVREFFQITGREDFAVCFKDGYDPQQFLTVFQHFLREDTVFREPDMLSSQENIRIILSDFRN